MLRSAISAASGVFIFAALAGGATAQTTTIKTAPDSATIAWTRLAFSHDGRVLREVGSSAPRASGEGWLVRIATYDAATGNITRTQTLPSLNRVDSMTSDGRVLAVSVDSADLDGPAHFYLLDADTAETQPIPDNWFEVNDRWAAVGISGDGKLVSAFSINVDAEVPLVVALYDWQTKELVGKQRNGFPAGGFSTGEVTTDGKIAFTYNRTGSEIVDPGTGRLVLHAGINSVRSPDGKWVVEFTNHGSVEPPAEITIEHGEGGQPAGKLDIQLTEQQRYGTYPGAFCGTTGKFVTSISDTVRVFKIPSGKKIASIAASKWRDPKAGDYPSDSLACSDDGKHVAIRSGSRLTVHKLK
ncbi:MAG: hypothetical protein ABSC71_06430 [Candidatus Acidiferrales bacterium]